MEDLEKRVADLEAWRAKVEPHLSRLMPIGPNPENENELATQRAEQYQKIIGEVKKAPDVDRNSMQLVSGEPVPEDRSHTKLKANGQQRDYVVLTPEERAKGFVRPVRKSYLHVGKDPVMNGIVLIKAGKGACGTRTTMGQAIAETYARDPGFYSGTFCCTCGEHRSLDEFVWEGTTEQVGS